MLTVCSFCHWVMFPMSAHAFLCVRVHFSTIMITMLHMKSRLIGCKYVLPHQMGSEFKKRFCFCCDRLLCLRNIQEDMKSEDGGTEEKWVMRRGLCKKKKKKLTAVSEQEEEEGTTGKWEWCFLFWADIIILIKGWAWRALEQPPSHNPHKTHIHERRHTRMDLAGVEPITCW